jgi:hypothetical protein
MARLPTNWQKPNSPHAPRVIAALSLQSQLEPNLYFLSPQPPAANFSSPQFARSRTVKPFMDFLPPQTNPISYKGKKS